MGRALLLLHALRAHPIAVRQCTTAAAAPADAAPSSTPPAPTPRARPKGFEQHQAAIAAFRARAATPDQVAMIRSSVGYISVLLERLLAGVATPEEVREVAEHR